MAQTPNHEYNVPAEGDQDWHEPLNENFERYDTDIEVRDSETNRADYVAKAGAKFFSTDTGATYIGDGSSWNRIATTGEDATYTTLRVDSPPSASTDVARQAELSSKADSAHTHAGDTLSPDTVQATRVEADTVVTANAGTIVWDARGQSIPSGTTTTIEFDNVEKDQRSQWNPATSTIEVTEPGNYLVSAGLFWGQVPSSGTNHWFTVRRNGNVGVLQDFASGARRQLQASRPVLGASSGDSFHLEVEQYEGSALDVGGSRITTYLSVVQL